VPIFTTIHLHLLTKSYKWDNKLVLIYPKLERLALDKHSSLLGPFVSYIENELLLIRPADVLDKRQLVIRLIQGPVL
jgi:hypothetical protein